MAKVICFFLGTGHGDFVFISSFDLETPLSPFLQTRMKFMPTVSGLSKFQENDNLAVFKKQLLTYNV